LAVLDLRSAMISEKPGGPLYYRTDSHWNDAGAYFAYCQIIRRAAEWFPILAPYPEEDFPQQTQSYSGDLVSLLGLNGIIREDATMWRFRDSDEAREVEYSLPEALADTVPESLRPRKFETENPDFPNALIFHDSFGEAIKPFLALQFRSSIFVPEGYSESPASVIHREPADLVIFLMVERSLQWPVVDFQP
jgi:hypothetical protein